MTERDSTEAQTRATRARAILVGGAFPVALALAAMWLMMTWLPELPDPIAVHWTGAGPDGFGPAVPFILAPAIIVPIYGVFAVAVSWRTTPSGLLSFNQKFLLVTGVWLSTLLSVGFGGSVAIQRGLSDAKDAADVGIFLLLGVIAGLILAAGAWFALPRAEHVLEAGRSAKPVDIQGEERLSWSRSSRLGGPALLIVCLATLVAAAAVAGASIASRGVSVLGVVVLVIVVALAVTNIWWRVSADHRGLTVRSVVGWPAKRVPLDEVRTVQVIDIHPTRDFGGYGWRWSGGGRSGVILRAGQGIEVTLDGGKRFAVTVDDAETGAAVLAALLKQDARR